MFDKVDHVVYINLDRRPDRREALEAVLSSCPAEKITRFCAIDHPTYGFLGCSKSHIAVLKMAIEKGWKNVLILEDDAVWSENTESFSIFDRIISSTDYDVILLGGTYVDYDAESYKLTSAQAASAYIVKNHYYKILLSNFERGLELLEKTGNLELFALDMFWKHLQETDNWYIVSPSLMIQSPGYSDIQKDHVSYVKSFN